MQTARLFTRRHKLFRFNDALHNTEFVLKWVGIAGGEFRTGPLCELYEVFLN